MSCLHTAHLFQMLYRMSAVRVFPAYIHTLLSNLLALVHACGLQAVKQAVNKSVCGLTDLLSCPSVDRRLLHKSTGFRHPLSCAPCHLVADFGLACAYC